MNFNYTSYHVSKSLLADILWEIMDTTVSNLGYDDCIIYMLDDKTLRLQQIAAHGSKKAALRQVLHPLTIPIGFGVVGTVAKLGKPEIVPDTRQCREYLVDVDIGLSEISVPIIYNNRVIGVIDSESKFTNNYSGRDISIFTEVAALTANKIAANYHQENLRNLTLNYSVKSEKEPQVSRSYQPINILYENKSDQTKLKKLTKTQIKILGELSKNKTSKQIAHSLGMSYRTVQTHRNNICFRLGLKGPNALSHYISRSENLITRLENLP